jgi:colanic acid/amylovoran biosynthesis glycosyltransferase
MDGQSTGTGRHRGGDTMKVLSLFRYFPTLTETFAHQELGRLVKRGVDVTIASMGSRDDGAPSNPLPECPTIRIPRRPLRGILSKETPGSRWLGQHQRTKDVARYRWFQHSLPMTDRVHVHFAGEAAEWAYALFLDHGIPYTVTVHAVDLFKPRPSLPEVLLHAETTFTVADHHVTHLKELGISSKRLRCGPDLERWTPSPINDGPFTALFVGRNTPKKGLDVLLNAWRQANIEGGHLNIISDVPAVSDSSISIMGPRSHAQVQQAIRDTHLLVAPCQKAADGDMDGVPLVLMEALATGRPVLTTNISGIPELVDDQVGWLVEPGSPESLAKHLRKIVQVPDQIRDRGRAGPARLQDRGYTLSAQVDGLQRAWGCHG